MASSYSQEAGIGKGWGPEDPSDLTGSRQVELLAMTSDVRWAQAPAYRFLSEN